MKSLKRSPEMTRFTSMIRVAMLIVRPGDMAAGGCFCNIGEQPTHNRIPVCGPKGCTDDLLYPVQLPEVDSRWPKSFQDRVKSFWSRLSDAEKLDWELTGILQPAEELSCVWCGSGLLPSDSIRLRNGFLEYRKSTRKWVRHEGTVRDQFCQIGYDTAEVTQSLRELTTAKTMPVQQPFTLEAVVLDEGGCLLTDKDVFLDLSRKQTKTFLFRAHANTGGRVFVCGFTAVRDWNGTCNVRAPAVNKRYIPLIGRIVRVAPLAHVA